MVASKILLIGAVDGQISTVFRKVAALHSRNAFAFAIVAGNLFAEPDDDADTLDEELQLLLDGKTEIPLPTYFTLGTGALPAAVVERLSNSDDELCANLTFLGKRSVFKTSEGIRIVALGGQLDPNLAVAHSKDKYLPFYTEGDANTLKGAMSADILITSQWPSSVRTGSRLDFKGDSKLATHDCIAQLCTKLKPRYHFSNSDNAFYEREPFFHPAAAGEATDVFHITRFLSLANYDNPSKSKWVYAFSLDPSAAPPVALPEGVTSSPLTFVGTKRQPLQQQDEYRFASNPNVEFGNDRPRKRRKHERAGPPDQSQCFFCISNAGFASHMVTSIGNESYLTTAKGPLTLPATFPDLKMPAHMLIMPMAHTSTLATIDKATRTAAIAEMHAYRRAMQKLVKEKSKGQLGAVTWEVSRAGGIHTHWQFLPVSTDAIEQGKVDSIFREQAKTENYPAFEAREPDEEERNDFFRVIVWDSRTDKDSHLLLPIDESFRFDLQFGRKVMAKFLRLGDRQDWRACSQSSEEEEKEAKEFRDAFEPYEPNADA